jgi:23S rRNA (uracil1939-C5)-methyltransferase
MNKYIQSNKQPVIGTIEKLSHDARGIARIDGKITFIEGVLPDEVVTFEYIRKKKDFDEGRLLSLLEPSIDRATPRCPHYTDCGGCSLQHVKESTQIDIKQTQLMDLFKRVSHVLPEYILPPLSGDHWHYRHKARLSVRYVEKKQRVLVGFREKKNPRYVAEINQCCILSSQFEPLLRKLPQFIQTMDARRSIAQIEVAVGDDSVALIFRHMEPLSSEDEVKLSEFGKQFSIRIFLQSGGPDTVTLFYPAGGTEFLTYTLPLQQMTYQFHPTDFTQINPSLNRLMVTKALELLELSPNDIVLDLFCGLGNFSLPIASLCHYVLGIEGSNQMVERAEMNARLNHITNVGFQCANLDDEMVFERLKSLNVNKILIDPPRAGALAFVNQIHLLNPECVLYISCDPATLARDAAILVHEKGYTLSAAGVMDMFSHTAHVESMALFQKRKDS